MKKATFGAIVGNRGFFPDVLVRERLAGGCDEAETRGVETHRKIEFDLDAHLLGRIHLCWETLRKKFTLAKTLKEKRQ